VQSVFTGYLPAIHGLGRYKKNAGWRRTNRQAFFHPRQAGSTMITDTAPKIYRVVIPAGIDLPTGVAGAKLACLLQHVLTLTCLSDERRYRGHWANVHSDRWQSLIGKHGYRRVINDARDAGYVEINEPYSDGSKTAPFTKSIRLAKKFCSGRAQIVTITNQPAIQRLAKSFEPDTENLGDTGLFWFRNLANFRLDETAPADPALRDPWTQLVLAKLLDNRTVATRCDFRRLHTLLTQTARDARSYLSTMHNEPLAIVDVSAAQPLIIGLLAASPPTNPTQPREPATTRRVPLLPYGAHFRSLPDVEKWIRLCESREIYRYLWQSVQDYAESTLATVTTNTGHRVTIDMRAISLSSFKRSSLIPLFDRLPQMEANPVFKIIVRDFPTIADFIRTAKSKPYRCGNRVISHQVLACLAQRFEAETIVDDVGRYLMQNHPDEPVATIHDAILCRQTFSKTAQQIIKTQFERFGVSPSVKIENLERITK